MSNLGPLLTVGGRGVRSPHRAPPVGNLLTGILWTSVANWCSLCYVLGAPLLGILNSVGLSQGIICHPGVTRACARVHPNAEECGSGLG